MFDLKALCDFTYQGYDVCHYKASHLQMQCYISSSDWWIETITWNTHVSFSVNIFTWLVLFYNFYNQHELLRLLDDAVSDLIIVLDGVVVQFQQSCIQVELILM